MGGETKEGGDGGRGGEGGGKGHGKDEGEGEGEGEGVGVGSGRMPDACCSSAAALRASLKRIALIDATW